jgi:hypothetical protein
MLVVVERPHPLLIVVIIEITDLVCSEFKSNLDSRIDGRKGRTPVFDCQSAFVIDYGWLIERRDRTTVSLLPVRNRRFQHPDSLRIGANTEVRWEVGPFPEFVVHLIMDGRFGRDEVTVAIVTVFDAVINCSIELLKRIVEVLPSLIGYVELDPDSTSDLHNMHMSARSS